MQGGVIVVGFAVCLKIKVTAGFLGVGDTFKLHSTEQYYKQYNHIKILQNFYIPSPHFFTLY